MSVPVKEENGDADDEGQSGTGESGSSSEEHDDEEEPEEEYSPPPAPAPPITAAERIKAMEERAANSRRERKVQYLDFVAGVLPTLTLYSGDGFGDIQRITSSDQQDPRT